MTPNTEVASTEIEDDLELDDDLEAQLGKIADLLATLAQAEELPAGFSANIDPFEANEVSFDSGSWLLRVEQVQAWLNLDEDVDPRGQASSPILAATKLFKAVGADEPASAFSADDGIVRLTPIGADLLAARLDSAVVLQEQFKEVRETLSHRQATDRWFELWDEEHQLGEASSEPIKAKTEIWPIQEFSDKAGKRKLNLSPTYQRGDVWPTGYSQKLIESVLRGIPLPSIILLKPQSSRAGGAYEVVDGKQRLTAILRFIGKHPDALAKVEEAELLLPDIHFKELFERDYKKFRRLWKIHMGETLTASKEAEYYFPFKLASTKQSPGLRGDLESLAGKYYCEIRDEIAHKSTQETVRDVFETVSEYKLPLIEYVEATPRQIHEVFNLYNRQGKHLTAEEIRNALFHELDLMRVLLVASGDNSEVETLAGFVPQADRWRLEEIGSILTDYRFGTTRYKRTKLLSWLTSLVFQPALQEDGSLSIRSTAKQIDEMLLVVERGLKDGVHPPLAKRDNLCMLISDLHRCLDAHSASSSWTDEFKDDMDGKKWQELQLVASLLGVFLLCVVVDDVPERLEAHHDQLLEFTAQHRRPEKTQNKTQWGFIGKVALGLVELVGIDHAQLDLELLDRYGVSCLPTLEAATVHYRPRPRD